MRDLAASCGALSVSRRRALDSTVLYDAVATQDTYTMIAAAVRRCRRLIAAAAALELMHDYDGRAGPWCDWSDPAERAWLVDELVADACAVLAAVEGLDLTGEQADAVGLLGVVAGQDVEADPEVPGRWRIARRTAAGRVISPEARHARKTSHSAETATRPTSSQSPTPASSPPQNSPQPTRRTPKSAPGSLTPTPPATPTPPRHRRQLERRPAHRLVLADSAYASGEALEAFTDAGWDTAIKPIERRPPIAGGFTRDDFDIDTDAQTVTCPAGHTRPVTSGAARFGKLCAACPLRARCTTSERGRSVTVDAFEARRQANKARWRRPGTQAAYRRHRPMAERSIAWLTRGKARRVPYRGVAANHLWLTTRAAAVNLVRLANLGAGFAPPAAA